MTSFSLSTSIDDRVVVPQDSLKYELYFNNSKTLEYTPLLYPAGIVFYYGNEETELPYFVDRIAKSAFLKYERYHYVNIGSVDTIGVPTKKIIAYNEPNIFEVVDTIYVSLKTILKNRDEAYAVHVNKKYDVIMVNATNGEWSKLVENSDYYHKWSYIQKFAYDARIILIALVNQCDNVTNRLRAEKSLDFFMGYGNMQYAESIFPGRNKGQYKPTRIIRGYFIQPQNDKVLYVAQRKGRQDINQWSKDRSQYAKDVVDYYKGFLRMVEKNGFKKT